MAFLFRFAGDDRPRAKRPAPKNKGPRPSRPHKNGPVNPPRMFKFDDAPLEKRELSMSPTPAELFNYNTLPMTITFRRIMRDICIEHNVTPVDVFGPDSRKHVVQARRQYCIRARETGASYTRVAKSIGVDHTTVIYFVQQGQAGYPTGRVEVERSRKPTYVARKKYVTSLTALQAEYVYLAETLCLDIPVIAQRMGKSKNAIKHYREAVKEKRALAVKLEQKTQEPQLPLGEPV